MVVSTSKVITPVFRVSYQHIWKPQEQESNGKKRNCWSVTAIFGKKQPNGKDTDLSQMYALANELKKVKFPNGGIIKMPWKDGNDPEKTDLNKNPEYKDSIIMTFRSYERPVGLVDIDRNPIIDEKEFYSGCFALASVNAFSYDLSTSKGISFGLCNLMKVKDGEPLSAVHKAEVDFAEVRIEDLGIDNEDLFG